MEGKRANDETIYNRNTTVCSTRCGIMHIIPVVWPGDTQQVIISSCIALSLKANLKGIGQQSSSFLRDAHNFNGMFYSCSLFALNCVQSQPAFDVE